MEENENIYISNINNRALRIISKEYNFDFLQRNRDIDISTFPKFWTVKSVDFNHTLGPATTQDAVKNAESDEYQ
jgi:hypothetical protein